MLLSSERQESNVTPWLVHPTLTGYVSTPVKAFKTDLREKYSKLLILPMGKCGLQQINVGYVNLYNPLLNSDNVPKMTHFHIIITFKMDSPGSLR